MVDGVKDSPKASSRNANKRAMLVPAVSRIEVGSRLLGSLDLSMCRAGTSLLLY
jgi:hypothetical protein